MSTRQWKTQDWSLLPHVVHSTVATSRKVTGPCPFQVFPRLLGQNSKKAKHIRWMADIDRARGRSSTRLVETESIRRILLQPLLSLKGDKSDLGAIQGVIRRIDTIGLSRDQLLEHIADTAFRDIEIVMKVKTMFTREYNKSHRTTKRILEENEEEEEEEDEEEEIELL
jgi:hypothetical protein